MFILKRKVLALFHDLENQMNESFVKAQRNLYTFMLANTVCSNINTYSISANIYEEGYMKSNFLDSAVFIEAINLRTSNHIRTVYCFCVCILDDSKFKKSYIPLQLLGLANDSESTSYLKDVKCLNTLHDKIKEYIIKGNSDKNLYETILISLHEHWTGLDIDMFNSSFSVPAICNDIKIIKNEILPDGIGRVISLEYKEKLKYPKGDIYYSAFRDKEECAFSSFIITPSESGIIK